MLKIRKNVFETNSSSTHSIAIPKKLSYQIEKAIKAGSWGIHFAIGEYGWEEASVSPANYLYTAICDCYGSNKELFESRMNYLKAVLETNNIEYSFEEPKFDKDDGYLLYGYIDHCDELKPFLDEIFHDSDKLLRFITEGEVFTGNDNECFDEETEAEIFENEHSADYDFFFKGN